MQRVASYRSPTASGDAVRVSRAWAGVAATAAAALAAAILKRPRRLLSMALLRLLVLRLSRGRDLLRSQDTRAQQSAADQSADAGGHGAHGCAVGIDRR